MHVLWRHTGEYIQLTNQLDVILQDVLQISCDDLDPQVKNILPRPVVLRSQRMRRSFEQLNNEHTRLSRFAHTHTHTHRLSTNRPPKTSQPIGWQPPTTTTTATATLTTPLRTQRNRDRQPQQPRPAPAVALLRQRRRRHLRPLNCSASPICRS